MITRIFAKNQKNRLERAAIFVLLAALLAEIAVFFILEKAGGPVTQNIFFAIAKGMEILPSFSAWIYKMVGPVLFPLIVLAGLQAWSSFRLWRSWKGKNRGEDTAVAYDALEIVEGASPGFGFLGTCISLIFTMHCMDPKLSQADMLKALLDNSSSAFGSTVCGISLAITAFLTVKIFKKFLLREEADQRNIESMNILKKEE